MNYVCSCCGQTHTSLPDIAFNMPLYAQNVPSKERKIRVKLNEDLCAVDEEHFFIRTVLLLPILDTNENLGFGVWVSQKQENFQTYIDNYDTNQIGPFFGWLSNEFQYKNKSTLSLQTMANFQGDGKRPILTLIECDHPLYEDHINGIHMDDALKLAHHYFGDAF